MICLKNWNKYILHLERGVLRNMLILSFSAAHFEVSQRCLLYKETLSWWWRPLLCPQNGGVNPCEEIWTQAPEHHDVEPIRYFSGQLVLKYWRSKDEDLMEMRRNRDEEPLVSAIPYAVLGKRRCIITDVQDNMIQCKFSLSFPVSTHSYFILLHPFTIYIHTPCHHHVKQRRGFWDRDNKSSEGESGCLSTCRSMQPWLGPVTLRKGVLLAELWNQSLLWGLL